MRRFPSIIRVLAFVSAASITAPAATLLDFTSGVLASDPTQQGRLSRNGIPQDWAASEPFPGVINTAVTYHYHIYSLNPELDSFVQLEIDDLAGLGRTFVSAYDGAYTPNSAGSPNFGFDNRWLGDEGFSGNAFGTDPNFFQVKVPTGHTLLLVVNTTAASNGGVGDLFHLTVEGFIDQNFTDAPAVPEPSTVVLSCCGMLLAIYNRKRLFS